MSLAIFMDTDGIIDSSDPSGAIKYYHLKTEIFTFITKYPMIMLPFLSNEMPSSGYWLPYHRGRLVILSQIYRHSDQSMMMEAVFVGNSYSPSTPTILSIVQHPDRPMDFAFFCGRSGRPGR
jgi:hypothetical protein